MIYRFYLSFAARCSHAIVPGRDETSVPEGGRQLRLVRVHHEHREELGRLRLAGIGADAVAVAGILREALSGLVDRHRPVIDLAADRPLALNSIRSPRLVDPPALSIRPPYRSESHCTGTSAGAPLFLIKTTRNFAGSVLLAFRSTR